MKFYYIIILFTTIFQTFSCVSMDQPEAPIIFPTPIPEELEKYFTDSDKKLTFPDKSKKKIIAMCKGQIDLHKKEILQQKQQEISDFIELQQQREQTLASIQKENEALRRKCTDLRSQAVELESGIQQKKVEFENQKTNLKKLRQIIQQEKNYRKRELRFNLPPIQSLMQQFGATDIACLKYRLNNLCYELENGERRNDVINGPYYDKKKGVLYYPINKNTSCTFCRQSAKITIVHHAFSTLDISTDSSSEFSFSHSDNDDNEVENL